MSLGFARDSVVNLRSLIHEDQDDDDTPHGSLVNDINEDLFECIDIDEGGVNSETITPPSTMKDETEFLLHGQASIENTGSVPPRGTWSSKKYESSESNHSDQDALGEHKVIRSRYSGFMDYADYDIDPYAINYGDVILGETRVNRNLFCCFFPFQNMFVKSRQGIQSDPSRMTEPTEAKQESGLTDEASNPDGERTTPDRLTAHPVSTIHVDSTSLTQSRIVHSSKPPLPLKGIMRKKLTRPVNNSTVVDHKTEDSRSRRNLFPTYDSPNRSSTTSLDSMNSQKNKKLSFFLMARVITVESRKDMSDMERSLIWWQHNDYDDFKKTARIITQAMIQGGSEIWLQTSNAWGKKQSLRGRSLSSANEEEHHKAIQRYGNSDTYIDEEEDANIPDAFESKWWCRFGHSRRGLEHIVSIEEGKQRQKNVKIAIQAVLDEQERQLNSLHKDSKKLATISMQYTSWARDLAHAAALADAEAVRSRFDAKAKTRLDYLTKGINQPISMGGNCTNASFILSANKIAAASILDANRSVTAYHKKENTYAPPIRDLNVPKRQTQTVSITVGTIPLDQETSDPKPFLQEEIHDPDETHENIAKLAAGFGHGRKIDMFSGINNLSTNKRIGAF
jgi:hypothetical protein